MHELDIEAQFAVPVKERIELDFSALHLIHRLVLIGIPGESLVQLFGGLLPIQFYVNHFQPDAPQC